MLETKRIVDRLAQMGYEKYVGVPCSYLKNIINEAVNRENYYLSSNEGDAVALASGLSLGGEKMVVLMQNSGLTNAMSPLTSLNPIFKIPILLFVGNRGGEKDEVQHTLMGEITPKLLEQLQIKSVVLSEYEDVAFGQLDEAIQYMEKTQQSFCFLINKGLFSGIEVQKKEDNIASLSRFKVLEIINKCRDKDTIIVTTTGFTSRELYTIEDHPNNMYIVGSMGCASSVGLGLAMSNKNKKVIVIDGDGAYMMRMSALSMLASYRPSNLLHVVLDNSTYESTGNQPTQSRQLDINQTLGLAYKTHEKIETYDTLKKCIKNWLIAPTAKGVYIPIAVGSVDSLGRPKESPQQVKERLVRSLNEHSR